MVQKIAKKIAGSGLFVIVLTAFILICYVAYGKLRVEEVYISEFWNSEAVSEERRDNIIERGYILYQPTSEAFRKILAQGDFKCIYTERYTEEELRTPEEKFIGGSGNYKIIQMSKDATVLEDKKFVEEYPYTDYIVSECCSWRFFRELSYNPATQQFSEDEVAWIESCGFTGFQEQIGKVEEMIAKELSQGSSQELKNQVLNDAALEQAELIDGDYSNVRHWDGRVYEIYDIYNQGVHFSLVQYNETNFTLTIHTNPSMCYVPQQYEAFVKEKTASGEYFLQSTALGEKGDVLVFGKNQSIGVQNEGMESANGMSEYNDSKNVTFVMSEGDVTDFYVTSTKASLQMQKEDVAFVEKEAKKIGKTVPKTGERASGNIEGLYIYGK